MKTIHHIALGLAALALAGAGYSQTMPPNPAAPSVSIRDNPGVLGHGFTDVRYSWVDFSRDRGVDADGYIAGLRLNAPLARGFDGGLAYNYYRENGHRNPFTNSDYDARYHQLSANGVFFAPMGRAKPFLGGGVGYQWSRGDIQRLRTFDEMWTWNATAGVELPLGAFALTPRISYTDAFDDNGIGTWHWGGELHHWFNERLGGYVDATFHEARSNLRANAWTYTAGLRMRF